MVKGIRGSRALVQLLREGSVEWEGLEQLEKSLGVIYISLRELRVKSK